MGIYHSYLHGLNPYPKKETAISESEKKEGQLFQLSENILNKENNYQFIDSKTERIPSSIISRQKKYEDKELSQEDKEEE